MTSQICQSKKVRRKCRLRGLSLFASTAILEVPPVVVVAAAAAVVVVVVVVVAVVAVVVAACNAHSCQSRLGVNLYSW